jgi:hypothetical protein
MGEEKYNEVLNQPSKKMTYFTANDLNREQQDIIIEDNKDNILSVKLSNTIVGTLNEIARNKQN